MLLTQTMRAGASTGLSLNQISRQFGRKGNNLIEKDAQLPEETSDNDEFMWTPSPRFRSKDDIPSSGSQWFTCLLSCRLRAFRQLRPLPRLTLANQKIPAYAHNAVRQCCSSIGVTTQLVSLRSSFKESRLSTNWTCIFVCNVRSPWWEELGALELVRFWVSRRWNWLPKKTKIKHIFQPLTYIVLRFSTLNYETE